MEVNNLLSISHIYCAKLDVELGKIM